MEKLADAKPLVPDRREEISQIIDGWKEIDREADRSVDRSTDRSGNTSKCQMLWAHEQLSVFRTWANKINADREKRQKERPGSASACAAMSDIG
jgi:hypothetical protein